MALPSLVDRVLQERRGDAKDGVRTSWKWRVHIQVILNIQVTLSLALMYGNAQSKLRSYYNYCFLGGLKVLTTSLMFGDVYVVAISSILSLSFLFLSRFSFTFYRDIV